MGRHRTGAGRAAPGDEVRLAAGAYEGSSSLDVPSGVTLAADSTATLLSNADAPVVVIKGNGSQVIGVWFACGRAGQTLFEITGATDITVSKCAFDGKGSAESALTAVGSQRAN